MFSEADYWQVSNNSASLQFRELILIVPLLSVSQSVLLLFTDNLSSLSNSIRAVVAFAKSAEFVKNSTDVLAARFRNYESEET